ncbi:septum formation inhibitor Maf [Corticibacter populi]|uniref:dTTP/UTP pyrophosphatase n=1 Tax=Corticibacter populi TaxID=1550736 RepID=A0A3M6QPM3_9BURK|nr:Maf family protein [Corticibacter populi]RMX05020.1 septum formation inhibitor Maf [Corticibacter populi]RZS33546.1 septum formation protein [Corticibacter populi]
MPGIYLASQSPRRSQLLTQIGVAHTLLLPDPASDIAEDPEALEDVLPGESPDAYVQRVTLRKLDAAQQRALRRALPPAPILCADTTVELGGQILGKPADATEARTMLERLSGSTHRVLTAVAVAHAGQVRQALSVSEVRFAPLSTAEVRHYLVSGEWQGKAGGYGIQGLAAAFAAHISGSHSGIMGLPLHETWQLLQALRWPGTAAGVSTDITGTAEAADTIEATEALPTQALS